MNGSVVSLRLFKQRFHFSSAHFTVFSATKRERLHGHNYYFGVEVYYSYPDEFLDYNLVKDQIEALCLSFDEYTLIPLNNPYVLVEHDFNGNVLVSFNGDVLSLPESDVRLIPVDNVTIEALVIYFAEQLIEKIGLYRKIVFSLSSGPGQSASYEVQR